MPYVLVHPFLPPRCNPYHPDLPTFTTSSRDIVHFFHSHGWCARHVYTVSPPSNSPAPPSLTSSRLSSPCSARSTGSIGSNDYICASSLASHFLSPKLEPDHEHEQHSRCLTSTATSLLSRGPLIELHCYLILLNPTIFHGSRATAVQIQYLRWYAHLLTCFHLYEGEAVDLPLPNWEALALQREGARTERQEEGIVEASEGAWRGLGWCSCED